jgi:hypothetical protein
VTTKLEKAIKREIDLDGRPYTVTIDPGGLKIVEKGRRTGPELRWRDLIGGDVAMAGAIGNGSERRE